MQNLSSEFATKQDSNRPAQLKKLSRGPKFRIKILEALYYLGSETQRRRSDCTDAQTDLRLCFSHISKTGPPMTWLIFVIL